ncbi:MAG TPA: MEDS domain-containing protein, partial [Ktedonobacteraceae bacterium]|nr:MEDS domain-containing protein [Ktedonobacteraceae bacterium]
MTTISWSQVSESEHIVQFCETDAFLIGSLSEFISTGLKLGDICIVLATEPHQTSLEQRLQRDGLEVDTARVRGEYISFDAAATLSQFMINGALSQERFFEIIGDIIEQAGQGRSRVRIFGELVTLLWEDGYRTEAIRLEELWNILAKTHSFSLFCTYPMYGFDGEMY